MAVPTLITDLSTTASSNAPAGSDSPSTLDDIQRAHGAFIAQLRDRDSAFALTLLDDADAAAARATLGAAASGANSDIASLTNLTGGALVTGAALFGYSEGSGGTVTQATSKSTAVTLNKPTGRIIMAADALAPGAVVSFTLNNSLLTAQDLVLVNLKYGSTVYRLWVADVTTGACFVNLENRSGGSGSDAVQMSFAVIKGSAS